MNHCSECINKRNIPGDSHYSCKNPDKNMTGDRVGIVNGWFRYPHNFDPTWMTKKCDNYEPKRQQAPKTKGVEDEN